MIRVDEIFKPLEILSMAWRVLAVGIDQDINVKKNHAVVP